MQSTRLHRYKSVVISNSAVQCHICGKSIPSGTRHILKVNWRSAPDFSVPKRFKVIVDWKAQPASVCLVSFNQKIVITDVATTVQAEHINLDACGVGVNGVTRSPSSASGRANLSITLSDRSD